MSEIVHRDPASAWAYLCEHGGIELDGRDEGLDRQIWEGLDATAPSLKDALAGATLEGFARVFFRSIFSFVAMFKDILQFFARACATSGKDQWILALDDVDIDLESFRRWLTAWTDVAKVTLEVPAIDLQGVWDLNRTLRAREPVQTEVQSSFESTSLRLPANVRQWVAAYDRDEYLSLPDLLLPPECPVELRPCAAIAQAVLERLREKGIGHNGILKLQRPYLDRSDALDYWTIAQNETDYWLRTFVVSLSAAATLLLPAELEKLGSDLAAVTDAYPTKPFDLTVSIADLESVISLPLWQKRYELYSVWVATEIVRALDGHEIELHHDNGRMAFAFKETLIATVHSSPGPFTLLSEKRVPLEGPVGRGRVGGVQPDHSLWTVDRDAPRCDLVVEVKHYKNSAKGRFVEVFEDYARAFPSADVYLVNHGPTGNAVNDVSRSVRNRCHAVEKLTATNREGRMELSKAVRSCVGEPIAIWPHVTAHSEGGAIMVFDVSSSMVDILRSTAMKAFVGILLLADRPFRFVGIDTNVVGSWPATREGYAAMLQAGGGSTDLGDSMRKLLDEYEFVIVVTDKSGLDTLQDVEVTNHPGEASAPEGIIVRRVGRH